MNRTKFKVFTAIFISLMISYLIVNVNFLQERFSQLVTRIRTTPIEQATINPPQVMPTNNLLPQNPNPTSTINPPTQTIFTTPYPALTLTPNTIEVPPEDPYSQGWQKTTMAINNIPYVVYIPNDIQTPTEEQLIQMQTEPIPLIIVDN